MAETIVSASKLVQKRDLRRIGQKLRIVLNPIKPVADTADKRKEIRNWDLWGPFFFCLMLASMLSITTNADDKTLLFEIVFVIVWLGGAIIAVNGQLLGGTISFFQSICLLGYCLFPLNIAAMLNVFLNPFVHIAVKITYVAVAFVWSTYCKSNCNNGSKCSLHQGDGSRRQEGASHVPGMSVLPVLSVVYHPLIK